MAVVVTGANALVKLGGEIISFATGVSVTHDNLLKEIPQLDDLEIAEYAENGHRCTVTINTIKLNPSIKIDSHLVSENSAANFRLDFPGDLKQILLQGEGIIEIVDATTEETIYVAKGAKWAGGSGTLEARGLWVGNWTFKCRQGYGI